MSRTVNGAALFRDREKEILRKMLQQVADFSGVEVLTYCLMNNHFHVLVRVPVETNISDAELMRRYRVLYPQPTAYQAASASVMQRELESEGKDAAVIRAKLLARMGDVSAFMKTLKQRFSTWFNKTHDRYGPLWSDRFKSVLVEGGGNALQTMAAYIDLNPVRAGLVQDPKDYRFCGYAEAVAGRRKALRGLRFTIAGLYDTSAPEALAAYRSMLFGKGRAPVAGRSQIDRQQALRELEDAQGYLPQTTLLHCRIRYFSEGAVLGSHEFVRSQTERWQRSVGRKYPAKPRMIKTTETDPIVIMKRCRGAVFT